MRTYHYGFYDQEDYKSIKVREYGDHFNLIIDKSNDRVGKNHTFQNHYKMDRDQAKKLYKDLKKLLKK